MRIKRQRLELDNKERMASRKLLDMEQYLAAAAVCTLLQPHLLRTCPASPPSSFIPCIFAAQGPTDITGEQVEGEDSLEARQVTGTKRKCAPFPYCLKCYSSFDLSSIYTVKYHLTTRICLYQLSFLISTIPSPHSHFPALSDLPVI